MPCRFTLILVLSALPVAMTGCGETKNTGGDQSFFEQVERAKRISDPAARASRLFKIGDKQRQAEDLSGAEDSLNFAGEACKAVEDPAKQASLFARLSYHFSMCENSSAAGRTIRAAQSAIKKIPSAKAVDFRHKVQALSSLARAHYAAKDINSAIQALQDAASLTEAMKVEGDADMVRRIQVQNSVEIASAYQAIKKLVLAQPVANQALEFAKGISKPRDRSDMIVSVAALQNSLKQKQAAGETFALAEKAAREIQETYLQGQAFALIAQKLIESGRRGQGVKLLDEADKLAKKVVDTSFRKQLEAKLRQVRP